MNISSVVSNIRAPFCRKNILVKAYQGLNDSLKIDPTIPTIYVTRELANRAWVAQKLRRLNMTLGFSDRKLLGISR